MDSEKKSVVCVTFLNEKTKTVAFAIFAKINLFTKILRQI